MNEMGDHIADVLVADSEREEALLATVTHDGTVLAELDAIEVRGAVDEAQARIAVAEAKPAQVRRGGELSHSQIEKCWGQMWE